MQGEMRDGLRRGAAVNDCAADRAAKHAHPNESIPSVILTTSEEKAEAFKK
jgi:hypothetical protein